VVGAACLECDEPAAEAGELIRRQLGDNFGDFFEFHVAQYSTAGRINLRPPMSTLGQKRTSHTGQTATGGSDESRLALHGASSGGAAMIASKSALITQGGDLRAVRRAQ